MLDHQTLVRFEEQFGSPGRALSRLIRPAIAAKKGKTLVWGDWSAIEARKLPWLADTRGAREVLQVFRESDADKSKADVYCREAANIDGLDADELWIRYNEKDKAAKDSRQQGKVAVLSLGFGGGVGALQNMAVNYGLYLLEAEAKVVVEKWRENNKWARAFWDALWEAFLEAMENPDVPYAVGRVVYMYDKGYRGGTMFCFLPDGRPLVYPELRWEKREVEDRDGNVTKKLQLTYRRNMERKALWYGVLAENVTQASAGSLLREKLVNLQPAPALEYAKVKTPEPRLNRMASIAGHTHDEIITECLDDDETVELTMKQLHQEMVALPSWGEGLPLAAEITTNWYYTKALD